jgi:uncharacterized protein
MENTIVWADIPVIDLERAITFYGAVLQRQFVKMEGMDSIAIEAPGDEASSTPPGQFPVSFDLAQTSEVKPSTDGPTVYLNSYGDPEGMLQRAVEAGGEVLMPVQDMGEMVGFIGMFRDTEGNRIGVHKAPERPGS